MNSQQYTYMAEFGYKSAKKLGVGKLRNAVEGLNKKNKQVRDIARKGSLVSADRLTREKARNTVKTAKRLDTFVKQQTAK